MAGSNRQRKAETNKEKENIMAEEFETQKNTGETQVTPETPAENGGSKRKKLAKGIEGTVVKITVLGGEKGEMSFDFSVLPAEIQAKLGPFGLGHKLGDAAAGTAGKDAEAAIQKVWDGLVASDWSVRAPAQPKIAVSTITNNLAALSPEEQEAAKAALAKLGISL